ncbi:MAG TPA: hypothetical protein VN133_13755 [Humibacter sp.]|nr:hypothetical protein [Humibacter sp.]
MNTITASDASDLDDYTAVGERYIVIAKDTPEHVAHLATLLGYEPPAHAFIEARFFRIEDAERYARSMRRARPYSSHRVARVVDDGGSCLTHSSLHAQEPTRQEIR